MPSGRAPVERTCRGLRGQGRGDGFAPARPVSGGSRPFAARSSGRRLEAAVGIAPAGAQLAAVPPCSPRPRCGRLHQPAHLPSGWAGNVGGAGHRGQVLGGHGERPVAGAPAQIARGALPGADAGAEAAEALGGLHRQPPQGAGHREPADFRAVSRRVHRHARGTGGNQPAAASPGGGPGNARLQARQVVFGNAVGTGSCPVRAPAVPGRAAQEFLSKELPPMGRHHEHELELPLAPGGRERTAELLPLCIHRPGHAAGAFRDHGWPAGEPGRELPRRGLPAGGRGRLPQPFPGSSRPTRRERMSRASLLLGALALVGLAAISRTSV